MYSPILAIIFGLLGTIILHISKAMQRQGIEIFDQIRSKIKHQSSETQADSKKPTIYIIGLILNNSIGIFNGLGTMFGPPSLVTGMFGFGLIALMLYSSKILREKVTTKKYLASLLIVIGTGLIGIDGIVREEISVVDIDYTGLIAFTIMIYIIAAPLLYFTLKTKKLTGLSFGLMSGAFGGMSPFFFGVAQKYGGGEGFLPINFVGWLYLGVALLLGSSAFLTTQWGFARRADASLLVPSYNTTYIILPVLAIGLLLPNYGFSSLVILGIAIMVPGLYMMQISSIVPNIPHNDEKPKNE